MRIPFLIAVLAFLSCALFAQEKLDSLNTKFNAALEKYSGDSSIARLQQLPDSLRPAYRKIDSIKTEFNTQASRLKNSYDSLALSLNEPRAKITARIDSLTALKRPTGKLARQLDSLNNIQQQQKSKLDAKLADLKSKRTGKLNSLDLPPEYKGPLQGMTKNVDGFSLDGKSIEVPALEISGIEMPKLDKLQIPNSDLSKYGNLPKLETPIGDLGNVTKDLKGYQDDLKGITSGNLQDAQQLPKTLEAQAGRLEGVQELQKQSAVLDDLKGKLEPLKDPASEKGKAVDLAKDVAVDHFAGKEEQLKNAMDQVSKYKDKYSSVGSIKDLPKGIPNAMKGRPFIERIVPGLFFQYQQKGFNLYDLNPYLGYRISGRFTAGAGWNQRFARDKKKEEWNRNARIFGPRAYVDFRLYKGFIVHVESEWMNTFVHTDIKNHNYQEGNREWVWSLMTGMKKDYKIYKNLRGTVLMQYNLFNPRFKAPYVDRLNSRIGFEYVLKKRDSNK